MTKFIIIHYQVRKLESNDTIHDRMTYSLHLDLSFYRFDKPAIYDLKLWKKWFVVLKRLYVNHKFFWDHGSKIQLSFNVNILILIVYMVKNIKNSARPIFEFSILLTVTEYRFFNSIIPVKYMIDIPTVSWINIRSNLK